jgi:hypothetical protein
MISHYVKKGRLPSEIYNLSEGEKAFLFACMIKEIGQRKKENAAINRISL